MLGASLFGVTVLGDPGLDQDSSTVLPALDLTGSVQSLPSQFKAQSVGSSFTVD